MSDMHCYAIIAILPLFLQSGNGFIGNLAANPNSSNVFGSDFENSNYDFTGFDYTQIDPNATDEAQVQLPEVNITSNQYEAYADGDFYDDLLEEAEHIQDSLYGAYGGLANYSAVENRQRRKSQKRTKRQSDFEFIDICTDDTLCLELIGSGFVCIKGRCIEVSCSSKEDCPGEAYECDDNGFCLVAASCKNGDDCGPNLECIDGICSQPKGGRDTEQCSDSKQCPPNQVCSESKCKDRDCEEDEECPGEDLICKSKKCTLPECLTDLSQDECGIGKICYSKRCEIACSVHDSCPEGMNCDQELGICSIGSCTEDADCGKFGVCEEGICRIGCARNDQCSSLSLTCKEGHCTKCTSSEDCLGGKCLPSGKCEVIQCTKQADCYKHQLCVNKVCVEETCEENIDCFSNLVCKNNKCDLCRDTTECQAGMICKEGDCIDEGKCEEDLNCEVNFKCQNGQCVQDIPSEEKCDDNQPCSSGDACCSGGICRDRCVDRTECADTDTCIDNFCRPDCSKGQKCPSVSEVCVNEEYCFPKTSLSRISQECILDRDERPIPPDTCEEDDDCILGQICNKKGKCEYESCNAHRDCNGKIQKCRKRQCVPVCSKSKKCPKGYDCLKKRCHKKCKSTRDCDSKFFRCNDGFCRKPDCEQCAPSEFCEEGQCVEKCKSSADCRRRENCIDGGCRNYRCYLKSDCQGRREECIRGECAVRPRPQRPRPPFNQVQFPRPRDVVVNVRPQRPIIIQRPPPVIYPSPKGQLVNGYLLVRGPGGNIIPTNASCPLFSSPSDQFNPALRCNRIFCRCTRTADCFPFRPSWSKGPLQCCGQSCVLGLFDGCVRDARVCVA